MSSRSSSSRRERRSAPQTERPAALCPHRALRGAAAGKTTAPPRGGTAGGSGRPRNRSRPPTGAQKRAAAAARPALARRERSKFPLGVRLCSADPDCGCRGCGGGARGHREGTEPRVRSGDPRTWPGPTASPGDGWERSDGRGLRGRLCPHLEPLCVRWGRRSASSALPPLRSRCSGGGVRAAKQRRPRDGRTAPARAQPTGKRAFPRTPKPTAGAPKVLQEPQKCCRDPRSAAGTPPRSAGRPELRALLQPPQHQRQLSGRSAPPTPPTEHCLHVSHSHPISTTDHSPLPGSSRAPKRWNERWARIVRSFPNTVNLLYVAKSAFSFFSVQKRHWSS